MNIPEAEGEERLRRGPFDSSQFLLIRSRASRRQIENDEGEAVLLAADAVPRGAMMSRIAAVAVLAAVVYATPTVALRAAAVLLLPFALRVVFARRRTTALYDISSRERLVELRPEPGRWRARHGLVDDEGRLIARFELRLWKARWLARDTNGVVIGAARLKPRLGAWATFGRGRLLRAVSLATTADMPAVGRFERRSPDFDGHDLLDLTADPDSTLDRRVAIAIALLVG